MKKGYRLQVTGYGIRLGTVFCGDIWSVTRHLSLITRSKSAGFTLIELIVASAVFVGVALVGFSTLANTERVRERLEAQTDLIEAAQLSLEALARDLRFAEFTIESATGTPARFDPSTNQLDGERITLTKTDDLGVVTTHYVAIDEAIRSDGSPHRYLVLVNCIDQTCLTERGRAPLTPDGVEVESIVFQGLTDFVGDRQPFVHIILSIRAPGVRDEEPASVIETTVTSRRDHE